MGMQGKIFKVKALFSQPITNGNNQRLNINKGDIGYFQVINNIGMGNAPILLINVTFNGQSIHIQSKGYVDPNISYDETLKQMLLQHENGKSAAFEILPQYESISLKPNFGYSNMTNESLLNIEGDISEVSNTMDFDLSNMEGLDESLVNAIGFDIEQTSGVTNESLLGYVVNEKLLFKYGADGEKQSNLTNESLIDKSGANGYSYITNESLINAEGEYSNAISADQINQGVGAVTSLVGAFASAPKSDAQQELKAACGRKPFLLKKKKQAYQTCVNNYLKTKQTASAPVAAPAPAPIYTAPSTTDSQFRQSNAPAKTAMSGGKIALIAVISLVVIGGGAFGIFKLVQHNKLATK